MKNNKKIEIQETRYYKCPHCGEMAEIMMFEMAELIYRLYVDADGEITYEQQDLYPGDDTGFFCSMCGKDLPLTYDEVEEILKQTIKRGDNGKQ